MPPVDADRPALADLLNGISADDLDAIEAAAEWVGLMRHWPERGEVQGVVVIVATTDR